MIYPIFLKKNHYCPVKNSAGQFVKTRSKVIFAVKTKQRNLWAKAQILPDSRY
jgi:hypothetical protein